MGVKYESQQTEDCLNPGGVCFKVLFISGNNVLDPNLIGLKNGILDNLEVKKNADSFSELERKNEDIFLYIKPQIENVSNFTLNITTFNSSLGFDATANEHYLISSKWVILNATSPTFSASAINSS